MIKQMCVEHGVTCVYTSKLFFDRFTSSITVTFPDKLRVEHEAKRAKIRSDDKTSQELATQLKIEDLDYAHARVTYVNELWDRFNDAIPEEAEYRMNKASVTFYHDDPTNLAPMIRALGSQITKVVVPRNESEIIFLRANTDKLIQDRYYLDNYPFKLVFKNGHAEHITSYVLTQFSQDTGNGPVVDSGRAYYYPSNNPTLYLTDFCDVVLTQIGIGEIIDKVSEVVLRS